MYERVEPFTTAATRGINNTDDGNYSSGSIQNNDQSQDVYTEQLSFLDQFSASTPQPQELQETEPSSNEVDETMRGLLRSVPPVRPAEVTPLASIYLKRDLSEYPMLAALAVPNPTIRVDMEQAEREATWLRYPDIDPVVLEGLLGTRAPGTIDIYNRMLTRYALFAASKGEPAAPATPYTLARFFLERERQGAMYAHLKRERDYISACMKMLGIESCTSDPLVQKTMRAIGRRIGFRHEGRAKPFMVRDLRRALPYLENLAKSEPDRALGFLLLLAFGIATMLRREELSSIRIKDIERTRFGYRVAVWKTKTKRLTEPPTYIQIERIHDERICPVRLIDTYLGRYGFVDGKFFRRIGADGAPGESGMPPAYISKIVGDVVVAAKIGPREDFSAHSLRNGGVNSAHEAGASLGEIRTVSLHASDEAAYYYVQTAIATRPMTAAIFQ